VISEAAECGIEVSVIGAAPDSAEAGPPVAVIFDPALNRRHFRSMSGSRRGNVRVVRLWRAADDETVATSSSAFLSQGTGQKRKGIEMSQIKTSASAASRGIAEPGQPLPGSVRAVLERGLGTGLPEVRVHTSSRADLLARRLGADAFTYGADIYFRRGRYRPGTRDGLWLLAHEAAHVIQQAASRGSGETAAAGPDGPYETAADRCADLVLAGASWRETAPLLTGTASRPAPRIQRHVSFEHRALGDLTTVDLVTISGNGPGRAQILQQQITLLEQWRYDPDSVTEQTVAKICPWIRTLRVGPDSVLVTYGELNALPDYLADSVTIDSLGKSILLPVLQVIRQEGYNQLSLIRNEANPNVTFNGAACSPWSLSLVNSIIETTALDTLTRGLGPAGQNHYQGLLARNACHFAPYSWYRWQASHLIARDLAQKAFQSKSKELARRAWVFHGYADHFLQDSFAAGHLVNKTLVMEWFIEWAAQWSPEPQLLVPDWDIVKDLTYARQPGLAGLDLYDPGYSGPSVDPQTALEAATPIGRMLASKVVGSGQTNQFTAYQQYLSFLTNAVVQLTSADLHDYYNDKSLWVASAARPEPFEIWGDETLLTGSNGAEGVQATSETAQLSQLALQEIIDTGTTSISTQLIRKHFPTSVRTTGNTLQDLKTWTLGQKSFCEKRFRKFLPNIKRLMLKLGSPRLGITSQDQGLAQRWSQSLPDCGYVAVDMLVQEGRVFAGADGYIYELDPATGRVLHSQHLTTDLGGGDTRLAADRSFLYAGVHGYAYGIDLANWAKPAWATAVGGTIGFDVVSVAKQGQRLYAGTNGYLYELDPATGRQLKTVALPSGAVGDTRIAADDEYLYAGVSGYAYGIKLTDWAKPAWNASVGTGVSSHTVSLLRQGDRLFTGSNGLLYQLDPRSGKQLSSVALPTTVGGETRIAADTEFLYAGVHGYAYAVRLTDWSKPAWNSQVGGLVSYGPVSVLADAGRLFTGSDGYIHQLDPGTGADVRPRVLLTYMFGVGAYDTRLAAGGALHPGAPALYAGVNGYSNRLLVNETDRPGTLFHTTEASTGFGRWTPNFDQAPGPMRAVEAASPQLFTVGSDGTLYRDSQDSAGKWPGLRPITGIPKVVAVAGVQNYFGYDAFAIATDGTLYHKHPERGAWDNWDRKFDGAPGMQAISCLNAGSSGECHVFGIGTDGLLYHNYRDYQGWHGWTGGFDGAPPVQLVTGTSGGLADRIEVFAIGLDGTLLHDYYDYKKHAWHGWAPNVDGAPPMASVTVLNPMSRRVEVLGTGTDGVLYRNYLDSGGWHGWTGGFSNAPKVTAVAGVDRGVADNTEAFAVGVDGGLYHNYFDYRTGQWSNWTRGTGAEAPIAPLAVAAMTGVSNTTEVFAISDR
jgi:hypothetical protein